MTKTQNPKASAAEVKAMKARIRLTKKAQTAALARLDMKAAHTAADNIRMYEKWIECYS